MLHEFTRNICHNIQDSSELQQIVSGNFDAVFYDTVFGCPHSYIYCIIL